MAFAVNQQLMDGSWTLWRKYTLKRDYEYRYYRGFTF